MGWALMRTLTIPRHDDPAKPYLKRWRLLETPWFGVFLHRITAPDPMPGYLHDHPWPFATFVLRGGYTEKVIAGPSRYMRQWAPARRKVRWFALKGRTDLHSIVALKRRPTWTLVLIGRRVGTWGFQAPGDMWMPFDRHLVVTALNCAARRGERRKMSWDELVEALRLLSEELLEVGVSDWDLDDFLALGAPAQRRLLRSAGEGEVEDWMVGIREWLERGDLEAERAKVPVCLLS